MTHSQRPLERLEKPPGNTGRQNQQNPHDLRSKALSALVQISKRPSPAATQPKSANSRSSHQPRQRTRPTTWPKRPRANTKGASTNRPPIQTANNRRAPPTARKTATPKQVPPERGRQKPREKMCEAHRDEVAPPASEASGTRGRGRRSQRPGKFAIRRKAGARGGGRLTPPATNTAPKPETKPVSETRTTHPTQHLGPSHTRRTHKERSSIMYAPLRGKLRLEGRVRLLPK